MERADEKKPTGVGGIAPKLDGVEMIVIARYGAGYGVSILGGDYSQPPTCAQAVQAARAWIGAMDAGDLGVAESFNSSQGAMVADHLRALLDASGSACFRGDQMPRSVEVPGRGLWIFEPEPIIQADLRPKP